MAKPENIEASISLGNLKHALKITGMANSKAAIMPILQGVRMEQVSTGLALEATDLDVYIRVVLPELAGPQKALITPAEKFEKWTKLLDGKDVTISADHARATVKCGRAKATLPVIPAANWPSNEIYNLKADGVTLTQGALARAVGFAQIAVSDDNSRYTLNGMQLHGDGSKLSVVSTEGHCLMLYTVPCEEKINLLMPGRLAKVLLPLLTDEDGGVDLTVSDTQILASIDADTKIYAGCNRMTGQFPNWQAIVPRDERTDVTIKVADLALSLERCALLSDEKTGAVDLSFAGNVLTIHAANAQHGEADEVVPFDGKLDAEFKTRINADFLRALVKKLSTDLTVSIPDNNGKALSFKAAPHEGESLLYIVMPMRM
jgi:DNA polymerase III subunit beta